MRRRGITDIVYTEYSSLSPARTDRTTGMVYINTPIWEQIKPSHRFFILLHELGHIILNTTDELKADEYAFNSYAEMGYPLTESVKALSRVLTFQSPEHYWRTYLQLERAKAYDYYVNGNKNAYNG